MPDNDCSKGAPPSILPNITNSRVCAVETNNSSHLQGCCISNIIPFASGCVHYCGTSSNLDDFGDCVNDNRGSNDASNPYYGMYCLRGMSGNITQDGVRESSGTLRISAPRRISWLLLGLLLSVSFFGDVSARIVHSLEDEGLERRQADGECRMKIEQNYTTVGQSFKASPAFDGGARGISVSTGYTNRTINGTSAAEARYDAFFDSLKEQTGRDFPAMSSMEGIYEFVAFGSQYVGWTPFLWCANGNVSDCAGTVGESNDATFVEVCGPVFVGNDPAIPFEDVKTGNQIQGILGLVTTS